MISKGFKRAAWGFAGALAIASLGLAADFVILRGGSRIDLQQPPVRQGNNVLLTRPDGTLLSIAASEIDWKATSAAKSAPPAPAPPPIVAPPETPADAVRAAHGPKARLKITDDDVGHVETVADSEKEKKTEGGPAAANLEVADYTQEKSGGNLVVRGNLRNVGTTTALRTRLTITVVDDKLQVIGTTAATLAGPIIEPGHAVPFSAMVPVGEKYVSAVRFTPQWFAAAPPASAESATGAQAAAASRPPAGGSIPAEGSSAPAAPAQPAVPPPVPTPYGRGMLYANPAPSAPNAPPADDKNGYIPGATQKEDQPKPPQ